MAVKKTYFLKQFGEHVRHIRLKKGITQFDLASMINKDRQSIQRVENGNINPSLFYLYELAEGLEIDLKTLVNFKPIEKKPK